MNGLALEALQILGDEVVVDQTAVRFDDAPGDGPRDLPAAELDAVEAPDPADAEAGRREERLVGVVRVVEVDVLLVGGVAEVPRQFDGGLSADAGQDELLARRVDRAVANEEDVAPDPLGKVA